MVESTFTSSAYLMLFHSHPLYSGGWIHLAFLENIVKPGQIKRKLSGIRLVSYSTSNASCQPVSNSLLWGRSLTGDLHTKQTQHMIYIKASASIKSNYTMWINCICIVYLLLILLSICEWLRWVVVMYESLTVKSLWIHTILELPVNLDLVHRFNFLR